MRLPDGTPESVLRFGNCDQMHMVGHQAVGPNLYASAPAPISHDLQISPIILHTERSLLPAVTPLADVMRDAWRHCPCNPRHARTLPPRPLTVKKLVCCP